MSEDAPQGEIPKPEEFEHQQVSEPQPAIAESVNIPVSEPVEVQPASDDTTEAQDPPVDDPSTEHTDIPDKFINNEAKARIMAEEQNDAFDRGERFPQNAAIRAGINYDTEVAISNAEGYKPNTL